MNPQHPAPQAGALPLSYNHQVKSYFTTSKSDVIIPEQMKDFFNSNKVFIGVTLATLLLLFGGIFLFTKDGSSSPASKKISPDILVPSGTYVTGGIVNGVYQEASKTAVLTLVEFGDYECPACSAYSPLTKQILSEFAGKINYSFRNFPLSQHKNALVSSYAAEAAGLQGKFWQMHDKLYESQSEWAISSNARETILGYAKDMGLNMTQFAIDIDSGKVKDKVTKDLGDGNLIGINSTPTFYINGVKVANLPANYEGFKKIIEDALKNVPQPSGSPSSAYHVHFDLTVFMNGSPVNFALANYQESKDNPLNPNIHFHDGNGKVVHVHKEGISLKELLDSLKFSVPAGAVSYVNGVNAQDILAYIPKDLDQILIGSSNLNAVSNDACIYSFKCPARGTPPPEECVGGLGTGCIEE